MRTSKYTVQIRLSVCFCVIVVLISSILLYIGKAFLFTGVSPKDIHVETTAGTVPYNITDIKEVVLDSDNSEYTLTFTSRVDKAPPITMTVSELTDSSQLGSEHMVEWVNVIAVYDKYIRSKDLVALEGSGAIPKDTILKAETETKAMLERALSSVTHPIFKWYAILLVCLTAIACIILVKHSYKIATRWASEDIWSQLSDQVSAERKLLYDKTYFGIDASAFVLEECPEPKLPFRFWASSEEFDQYVKSRGIQLDRDTLTARDKKNMTEDSETIMSANALKRSRGVICDLNVSGDADKTKDDKVKDENKHITETQGVRRKALTGSTPTQTASRLPAGNMGTIKRKAAPSHNSLPQSTTFKRKSV